MSNGEPQKGKREVVLNWEEVTGVEVFNKPAGVTPRRRIILHHWTFCGSIFDIPRFALLFPPPSTFCGSIFDILRFALLFLPPSTFCGSIFDILRFALPRFALPRFAF
jgi:hypothetical protein